MISILLTFSLGLYFMNYKQEKKTYESNESPLIPKTSIYAMTIVQGSKRYSLQDAERAKVVAILSQALHLKSEHFQSTPSAPVPLDKLILHLKDANDLEMVPISLMEENIVFSISGKNKHDYLIERSQGQLSTLIQDLVKTQI